MEFEFIMCFLIVKENQNKIVKGRKVEDFFLNIICLEI